jgi:hypothetical protein
MKRAKLVVELLAMLDGDGEEAVFALEGLDALWSACEVEDDEITKLDGGLVWGKHCW